MDRRTYLAATGVALSAVLGGCFDSLATEDDPTDQSGTPSDSPDDSGGAHDLFVENYTDTTEVASLEVVREDGDTVVDGRYELPDGRGIEFEDVAAWETTYTIELTIGSEETPSLEWYTEECGPDSEAPGESGSRNAAVRVEDAPDDDAEHRVSLVVDECDALHSPGLPTGPAGTFRLDE